MASNLTKEQKFLLGSLYKIGRKVVHFQSHVNFLCESLRLKFIPKRFHIKNNLPGDKLETQKQLDLASFISIESEKNVNENKLKLLVEEFERLKEQLVVYFSPEAVIIETNKLEKHLKKVETFKSKSSLKKIRRNFNFDASVNFGNVTLASDDERISAHKVSNNFYDVSAVSGVTIVNDDELLSAHKSIQGSSNVISDVTLANDDELVTAHKSSSEPNDGNSVRDQEVVVIQKKKKKRRFKRRYLQPQLKRKRRRKRNRLSFEQVLIEAESEGWNGILKNISGQPTSSSEFQLFSKGKQFAPVELDPPIIRMQKELNRFYRILRIRWLFNEQPDTRTELERKFYQKSVWEPPKASVEVENFITDIQHKFDRWKPPRWIKDNLSNGERALLSEISKDTQHVYMWEDKGPSFTKMTKEQYLEAGSKELSNRTFYEEVSEDLSKEVKRKNDILVQSMIEKGEITEKVGEFLVSGGDKLSNFYHLLKTHNIPTDVSDPSQWLQENGFPIRGIISGLGSPTERLSGFIDHFLQPGMKSLGTFLQDTKHTLQIISQLNDQIDRGEISLEGVNLVSLDVNKMYNNITEDLGKSACQKYLQSRSETRSQSANEEADVSTTSIMEGLELCLKNNYFSFNGKIYRQLGGVGTGIKLAPPYACIAMGDFEDNVFNSQNSMLELILLWKRFIDDIFLLFKGSRAECEMFLDWLNSIMPGVINLKCNFSEDTLEFLDLKIMIKNGRLETELYVKPTNLQLFLDYTSNHPTHCKDAIVYCQALRVVERCSEPSTAQPHLDSLKKKFLDRQYPEDLVEKQFQRAKSKDRKSLIFQKRKDNVGGDNKIRLIFTYNRGNPPLHKWIRESRKFLVSTKGKELGRNMQVTYKQPRNLRKIVTGCRKISSEGGPNIPTTPFTEVGCFKCNHCKVSCPKIVETTKFSSTNTGRSYRIKQKIDCDSSYVIYLITCSGCKGQYVGKSVTSFKNRHSNHMQEIKHGRGGLGQHYGPPGRCSKNNITITLIEQVEVGDRRSLAKREQFWQHQLRAFVENGGNAQCIKKELI